VHLSYFNLEYLFHLIFILIPLWRGFYFSKDMLSDEHTKDVSYRRTKPWCGGSHLSYVGALPLGGGLPWHGLGLGRYGGIVVVIGSSNAGSGVVGGGSGGIGVIRVAFFSGALFVVTNFLI
jgi:hypothetical protein